MRTFAVANQKGGCGKTTVSINLGACLAREGRRVLLIDMDPQGHCALGLAVPEEQIELSISDVLIPSQSKPSVDLPRIVWQITANFDLAPSRIDLAGFEPQVYTAEDREMRLGKGLEAVRDRYDVVLIDCPPSVGLLSFNALCAADDLIIPVDTGYFSLQGLSKQLETIDHLAERTGRKPTVHILANQYDVRTKLAREILAEMRRKFDPITKLREGSSFGQPITEYDPTSMGFRDFVRLAREVLSLEAAGATTAGAAVRRTTETTAAPSDALMRQADEIAASAKKLLATSQTLMDNLPEASELANSPVPVAAASHEEIEQRIEQIYGVRQTPDGLLFVAHAPGARQVLLAGDFNEWKPDRNPMMPAAQNGDFRTLLRLSPGIYRYRLVIDGDWRHDPANTYVEANPFGGLNSVVEVV
jgi:chromosome partitioning protein